MRGVAAGVLALCGGLSVVYFLFAALGAVDLGDAAVGSAIALVLGAALARRRVAARPHQAAASRPAATASGAGSSPHL